VADFNKRILRISSRPETHRGEGARSLLGWDAVTDLASVITPTPTPDLLPDDEPYAIVATGLVKRYGETTALAGIDLDVRCGTVTAVLGPNGAGKTTAVRILTTLTDATEGSATVAGFDVKTRGDEVRRRIGLAAQDATVDPLLTGRENLVMLGELYQLSRKEATQRAGELLEQFSLTEAGDRVVSGYSGGMRRRLDLAATLVAKPQVLFLDEPTTGLDPRARSELWDVLDTLVNRGTTLLLTTQYLEEAERLADDIIVIDRGRIIARGDSRTLKREVGGDHIYAVILDPARLNDAANIVAQATGTEPIVDHDGRSVNSPTTGGVDTLVTVATRFRDAGIAVDDLSIRQPTLDDVFLTLTGEPCHDEVVEQDAEKEVVVK
jgi:ABC-2 type transport system ATP-binding protein